MGSEARNEGIQDGDDARADRVDRAGVCDCNSADCCPAPGGAGDACCAGRWKTPLFAVVMLAAVAVAVHGVVVRKTVTPELPADAPAAAAAVQNVAERNVADTAPEAPALSSAQEGVAQDAQGAASDNGIRPASSELETVGSFAELIKRSAKHDFMFVVMPGETGALPGNVFAALAGAVAKIRAQEVQVGAYGLSRDAAEFSVLAGEAGVKEFPAVLALRRGRAGALVESPITETSLLRAYLSACVGSASCCPSGGAPGGTGGGVDTTCP